MTDIITNAALVEIPDINPEAFKEKRFGWLEDRLIGLVRAADQERAEIYSEHHTELEILNTKLFGHPLGFKNSTPEQKLMGIARIFAEYVPVLGTLEDLVATLAVFTGKEAIKLSGFQQKLDKFERAWRMIPVLSGIVPTKIWDRIGDLVRVRLRERYGTSGAYVDDEGKTVVYVTELATSDVEEEKKKEDE